VIVSGLGDDASRPGASNSENHRGPSQILWSQAWTGSTARTRQRASDGGGRCDAHRNGQARVRRRRRGRQVEKRDGKGKAGVRLGQHRHPGVGGVDALFAVASKSRPRSPAMMIPPRRSRRRLRQLGPDRGDQLRGQLGGVIALFPAAQLDLVMVAKADRPEAHSHWV